MMTIWDAIRDATARNEERDRRLMERQQTYLLPQVQAPQAPLPVPMNDGGGDGTSFEDTRTDEEKYRDAIKVNKYAGAIPVIGTPIALMNDYYIQEYERENPSRIAGGQRYSTVGRLLGFGDPGTTGFSGVFGSNSDLWNAGLYSMDGDSGNDATGNVGYRGDAYRAETGGGMGPSWSGPSDNGGSSSDSFSGGRDDDGWGE